MPAKNKFFVVLKNLKNKSIIAALPTSKDSIPVQYTITSGCACIEHPEINFNCFTFCTDIEVTDCGKKFEQPTFVYGYQVDDYEIETLFSHYQNEGLDYFIWGQMRSDIFGQLIDCLKTSKTLKRKYKRKLNLEL